MHLQLTISLLVSDRITSIRRCLDSLVPLLMQVPSELIITDTSENEEVRNLALQYTDHVIPFHWCNDFSKARNVGIQAARGEWFLYIDDDEWFEDVSEIVEFFLNGTYLSYNSATYIVRNYTQWNGTDYIDAHLGRMVRLTPEVKFVNAIHEYISPYNGPIRSFSAYAHHYGYVRGTMDSKNSRNLPMLEKELEDNGPTPHLYLQLTQEYMSDRQYEKAEEYAWKCIELGTDDRTREKGWCIAYLPHFIRMQGEAKRALETGKKMLRHPFCTEMATLYIYTDLIEICKTLKNHDKDIIIFARSYHQGLFQLDARPERWFVQSIGTLSEQQVKIKKFSTYLNGLLGAVNIKDSKSAQTFLQWLLYETGETDRLYPAFSSLLEVKGATDFLLEEFDKSDIEDSFVYIARAIKAWKDGNIQKAQKYYTSAIKSKNIIILRESVLLSLESQCEIPLDPLMDSMNISQWQNVSHYITEKAELGQLSPWITSLEMYLDKFPLQTLSMMISLQERLLMEGVLEINDKDIFQEMKNYCDWVKQYYSGLYHADFQLPGSSGLMPQNFQFVLKMEQVFGNLEENNYPQALQGLGQAIEIYQPLCGAIRRMLSVIEEEIKRPARSSAEFEILGAQIKGAIKGLIQENRYSEAFPLIQQLSSLLPKDLEVLRLRQALWNHIGQ